MHTQSFRAILILLLSAIAAGCGSGGGAGGDGPGGGEQPPSLPGGKSKGIVFVAQTPSPNGTADIGTSTATFGNGEPSIDSAARGGSLYFLERGGRLRDLLDEALRNGCDAGGDAICDPNGALKVDAQGLLVSGYAVRRPEVHWGGDRVLFSMTRGAIHKQFGDIVPADPLWQLYEISGLDPDDKPLLTKLPNQPPFNNVEGVYGSEGAIFFVSDMPVTGNAAHYPQLDEYESRPVNTGLWKLHPETGELTLMDHSPSGDFGPEITPRGQVIFTRWDHLQRDQQAENSKIPLLTGENPDDEVWGAYTYADENDVGDDDYRLVSDATREGLTAYLSASDDTARQAALTAAANGDETFPEPVRGNPFYNWGDKNGDVAGTFEGQQIPYTLPRTEYGAMNALRFNHFLPWQIRQDGLQCETYRHTGLHENGGFVRKALLDDPNITDIDVTLARIPDGFFLNQVFDEPDTGFEVVTGVVSPEFGTHKSGRILQFVDTELAAAPALHENADAVQYRDVTDPDDPRLYRDPLFLSDGRLIAAVSRHPGGDDRSFTAFDFRLHFLERNAAGFYEPAAPLLDADITRAFDFWEENGGLGLREFNGALWQIEAQEVIARDEPLIPPAPALEDPEQDAFAQANVDPETFRKYLEKHGLAAIVVRNATLRDEADVTQPFNLQVELPGGRLGEQSVRNDFVAGTDRLYPITYLQLMRGDYLRGYRKFAQFEAGAFVSDRGRRVLPKPLAMTDALAGNLPVAASAPVGAVPVDEDGSIAALVPARRALTWQTTDGDGDAVVRERYWLTFQPGEVRVCASCHGINDHAQDGNGKPENTPKALIALLRNLKQAGAFDNL